MVCSQFTAPSQPRLSHACAGRKRRENMASFLAWNIGGTWIWLFGGEATRTEFPIVKPFSCLRSPKEWNFFEHTLGVAGRLGPRFLGAEGQFHGMYTESTGERKFGSKTRWEREQRGEVSLEEGKLGIPKTASVPMSRRRTDLRPYAAPPAGPFLCTVNFS